MRGRQQTHSLQSCWLERALYLLWDRLWTCQTDSYFCYFCSARLRLGNCECALWPARCYSTCSVCHSALWEWDLDPWSFMEVDRGLEQPLVNPLHKMRIYYFCLLGRKSFVSSAQDSAWDPCSFEDSWWDVILVFSFKFRFFFNLKVIKGVDNQMNRPMSLHTGIHPHF